MACVELRSIQKKFGDLTIIPDLDLKISSGEFVALVGPSGCGKSTLLRMIAGLDHPSHGTVTIGDRIVNDVSPRDRGVGMVFQNYALYPHMTVRQNLAFPLKMAKLDLAETRQRVAEVSAMLGLDGFLDRKPAQMSGGQKQRVAMGRAMVSRPRVLLFDEPLSNLDAQLRIKVRAEIAHLHKKIGSTVIYVTHDQVEAMTLADRIAILNHGQLEQLGAPLEVYREPRTRFVASFIGTPAMNFVPALDLCAREADALNAPAGAESVGFRPEVTRLGGLDASLPGLEVARGPVSLVEPLGSTTYVHVRAGETSLIAEVKGTELPVLGQSVRLRVARDDLFFFNHQGRRLR